MTKHQNKTEYKIKSKCRLLQYPFESRKQRNIINRYDEFRRKLMQYPTALHTAV